MWRNGIKAFFVAFHSRPALARAATEALATSSELRAMWSGFMQKWIDHTRAVDRGRTGARRRPGNHLGGRSGHVAESDERAHDDGSSSRQRQPAVDVDRVIDTLTHIWVTSIYGESE